GLRRGHRRRPVLRHLPGQPGRTPPSHRSPAPRVGPHFPTGATDMNPEDTLPPAPSGSPSSVPAGGAGGELWPTSGPAKGFRVRLPVAVAAAVVIALAGAAAGASLKKGSSSSSTQAGAIANRPRNLGGATGTNGTTGANGANGAGRFGAGGGGGGVAGTITKVEGNTITLTQRDGSTATVVVPSGTAITKTVS